MPMRPHKEALEADKEDLANLFITLKTKLMRWNCTLISSHI